MPKKEKPLPRPPSTPFGRKRPFGNEGQDDLPLLAEEITIAASQGRLEEFIRDRLSDNEYTRKLVEMLMGISGIVSAGNTASKERTEKKSITDNTRQEAPTTTLDDVVRAVNDADVSTLIDLFKKEQERRSVESTTRLPKPEMGKHLTSQGKPTIEKEIVDELVRIAKENNLSIDWVLLRAIKRYIQEYKNSGVL